MSVMIRESPISPRDVLWKNSLPATWKVLPLKRATIHLSRGIAPEYGIDSAVQVLNQACVQWSGIVPENCKYHVNPHVQSTKGYLRRGDVVMNSTGTGTLGRTGYFDIPGTWIADAHITIVRPLPNVFASRYLHFLLGSIPVQEHIYATMAVGATNQIELNINKLGDLKVLCPPCPSNAPSPPTSTARPRASMHWWRRSSG